MLKLDCWLKVSRDTIGIVQQLKKSLVLGSGRGPLQLKFGFLLGVLSVISLASPEAQLQKSQAIGGFDFPGGSEVKTSACNAGDLGSIPGLGRSPGEGNGNPLQYSCLENPIDGGVWWSVVHGVVTSRTRLSDFTSLQDSSLV